MLTRCIRKFHGIPVWFGQLSWKVFLFLRKTGKTCIFRVWGTKIFFWRSPSVLNNCFSVTRRSRKFHSDSRKFGHVRCFIGDDVSIVCYALKVIFSWIIHCWYKTSNLPSSFQLQGTPPLGWRRLLIFWFFEIGL